MRGDGGSGANVEVRAEGVRLLDVRDLWKTYGGVHALAGVDFDLAAGEVHAIVGQNGAGKSTLIRILVGAESPDHGSLVIDGRPASLHSPREARRRGIAIVYQELSLFPSRTVAANLFAAAEPTRRGMVSRRKMRQTAEQALRQVHLEVDLDAPLAMLGLADRQRVEICRALLQKPRILILDEPNSALNAAETDRLFAVLRRLQRDGIAIVYVSHRLQEVLDIADRVTVMRNGRSAGTSSTRGMTMTRLAETMLASVGETDAPGRMPAAPRTGAEPSSSKLPALRLRHLRSPEIGDVSLDAAAGAIIGVAGLDDSGASALLDILFGRRRADADVAILPDGSGLPRTMTNAARRGIGMVPADRRRHGLMIQRSVADNLAHVTVGTLRARSPWVTRRSLSAPACEAMRTFAIKASSPRARAHSLSGGNQQKVVIAKWAAAKPGLLLLDDPTRGVDVAAKQEIYTIIRRLAADGGVVLMTSSEPEELCELCERILVFYRGNLAGEFSGGQVTHPELLRAINGGDLPVMAVLAGVQGVNHDG